MGFKAEHMNAVPEDFAGNNGLGRYVFFPGSDGRAAEIAEHFSDISVKEHPRRHHVYKGTLTHKGKKIDVASISSGMGSPSLDIIANELFRLGVKRFLRVGTAGLLQPAYMKAGDFVIATSAVKDDGATQNYVPLEVPALASIDMVLAAERAAKAMNFSSRVHKGMVHSKASLYAREFKSGPMADENARYMKILSDSGVLASEMEASMLFTLSTLFNHALRLANPDFSPAHQIKVGANMLILGEGDDFGTPENLKKNTEELIAMCLETVKNLAAVELGFDNE